MVDFDSLIELEEEEENNTDFNKLKLHLMDNNYLIKDNRSKLIVL